jgi:hypothetical protein
LYGTKQKGARWGRKLDTRVSAGGKAHASNAHALDSHKKEMKTLFLLRRVWRDVFGSLSDSKNLSHQAVFSSLHGTSTGYTVFPEFSKNPPQKKGNRTRLSSAVGRGPGCPLSHRSSWPAGVCNSSGCLQALAVPSRHRRPCQPTTLQQTQTQTQPCVSARLCAG